MDKTKVTSKRRLLLLSLGISSIKQFVGESKGLKMAFITTAGNTYSNTWWVASDRKKLKKLGFRLFELDIKDKNLNQLTKLLLDKDILYVAGGNSFYLLEKMHKSGMDKLLPRLLDKGIMYVGSSAGAVVVGTNLKPISLLDDPSKAELTSTKALGLVDFVPLPHYGEKEYAKEFKQIIKQFGKKYKLVPITNKQAIIVNGTHYKVVNSV
jgi:dipeptidase E